MKYYFLIFGNIYVYSIEYVLSIAIKFKNSEIIIVPINPIPEINNNNIYIFIGIHYVHYPFIDFPNVYYLNLEQLTIDGVNSPRNLLKELLEFKKKSKHLKLLDYSGVNVSILKQHNISSIYIPYQVNYDEIYNFEKSIDFVMCCNSNNKKINLFNQLKSLYPNSHFLGLPPSWGKERDNILFKSKILINVHHDEKEYKIIEEIRITRCILNKMIVISESSINPELYPLNSYIIYAENNDIVTKTKDVLDNYNKYYSELYDNFNINNIDNKLKTYLENLPS